MTTLRDIALRAGVSISTASRALSGEVYVRDETRARVKQIAQDLSYRPNAVARGLRRSGTRTVGLLVPDIRNGSYSSAAAALQGLFQDFGYGLVLYVSKNDPDMDRRCLQNLYEQQVDGVLHVPCTPVGAGCLRDLPRRVPVVEMFRRSQFRESDAVLYDEDVGSFQIVRHLLELGHRSIGVIGGPRKIASTARRINGAYRAVAEAGLPPGMLHVFNGEYTLDTGRQALPRLLECTPTPTAIMASSTQFILGAALASQERGIAIPSDLSLAGFGDPEWLRLINPPITTYASPMHEMGITAAQLLMSRIEDGDVERSQGTQVLLSGHLIIRGSTAPPRAAMAGPPAKPRRSRSAR